MKLRLHNNTVRLRLSQGEVASLGAGGRIEQTIFFSPSAKLVSSVESAAEILDVQVTFDGALLAVRLPLARAEKWAHSDEVGIEGVQAIDDRRSLQILIEKDFQCLHPMPGEIEDAFPNPRLAAADKNGR